MNNVKDSSASQALQSVTFLQTFAQLSNITANMINSTSHSTSPNSAGEVYGPMDSQGQFHLLMCNRGYLLVNDTVSSQGCFPCAAGTYSVYPMDGCGYGTECIQRSSCNLCPSGATCGGLSDFEPQVNGSVWKEVFDRITMSVRYHLISCPAGKETDVVKLNIPLIYYLRFGRTPTDQHNRRRGLFCGSSRMQTMFFRTIHSRS